MNKIFISGSISIKELDEKVIKTIDKIIQKKYEIMVGDAEGIDKLIQDYLAKQNYENVIIYHIGEKPRNHQFKNFKTKKVNFDDSLKSEREKQYFKDEKMFKECDKCFCIWNGRSKGTYENIKRVLENREKNREIAIYYNQTKEFIRAEKLQEYPKLRNRVDEIYEENNGYSLKEIYEDIKEDYHCGKYKDFIKQLEEEKLITKDIAKKKEFYKPCKLEHGIENKYKGTISSYRFTNEFFELVQEKFKKITNTQPQFEGF